jgi:hypothetical protein
MLNVRVLPWNSGGIIGSGASFSGLGAASWGPNRIDVFAVIAPNVVHRWYDPNNVPQGWSTVAGHADQPLWEPLDAPPGGAQGSPAVTSWGPNRIDVFVRSGNGQIYHRWYDPNNVPQGWVRTGTPPQPYWESLGEPPGGADGSPAATSWGPNRLDVFVKNRDGNFYHRWYDLNNLPRGWSTVAGQPDQPFWEPLGTPPAGGPPQHTERPNWPPGSPAATAMGTNRLDVFVHARDDDFFVWHKYFQGDRWSNWESRHPGTHLAGDPTAASWDQEEQILYGLKAAVFSLRVPSVLYFTTGLIIFIGIDGLYGIRTCFLLLLYHHGDLSD